MATLSLLLVLAAFIGLAVCLLWRPARLAVAAAVMILFALPAAAQGLDSPGIIALLAPQILELVAILLMAMLTWAAAWAKRKFGVDIEAKHRDALHSALMTGARLAASRQLTGAAAVALVVDYARQSVPDALAKLAPPQAVLKDLAEAKVQAVVQDRLGDLLAGVGLPRRR